MLTEKCGHIQIIRRWDGTTLGTWIMYFPEDRRTDLQDASGKVLGPQGISCVHPKEVWRFARESSR